MITPPAIATSFKKFRREISCFDSCGFCGTVGFMGGLVIVEAGFATAALTGEVVGLPIGVEVTGFATEVEVTGFEIGAEGTDCEVEGGWVFSSG